MRIELARERQPIGMMRSFTVWADSEQIGKFRHGERISLVIPPGTRALQVRLDWQTSPQVLLDDLEGGALLTCGSEGTGFLDSMRRASRIQSHPCS